MASNFLFVDGLGGSAKDPGVKLQIRKQAMKHAAESRRRDGYRRNRNTRQYPVFDSQASEKETHECDASTALVGLDKVAPPPHFDETTIHQLLMGREFRNDVLSAPIADDFHRMRIRFDLDPRNLCRSTSVEMGRAANDALLANPRRILSLIGPIDGSFMNEVPARYQNCRSLQAATEAVVALVRSILNGSQHSDAETSLHCYARALRTLQAALDSPATVMSADILCATQMLSLYELLNQNQSSTAAWVQHVNGAAKLVRIRGPTRFTTEYEKNLLVASSGPILSESVLNNEACFLAEPEWNKTLWSLIAEKPPLVERHEAVVRVVAILIHVPGLLKNFTNLIQLTEAPSHELIREFMALRDRAELLLEDLQVWHDVHYPAIAESGLVGIGTTLCLRSLYSLFSILLCRILSSANPAVFPQAPEFEQRCQTLAQLILDVVQQLNEDGFETLLIAQKVKVAKATMATREDWDAFHCQGPKAGNSVLIGLHEFQRWCELFGRKT